MKKKTIFITIAIIALLVQITFPIWWLMVLGSFFQFWNEGLIEGGLFRGSFTFLNMLLTGAFSIYSIIALISPIWSFFSIKGMDSEQIYAKKKNIFFPIINILTIILAISLVIWNKGFIPRI